MFCLPVFGVLQNNHIIMQDHDKSFLHETSWACPNGCVNPLPPDQLKQLALAVKQQAAAAFLDYGRKLTGIRQEDS